METLKKIMVVDDDPLALQALKISLAENYDVETFSDVRSAENYLQSSAPALVLLDLNLPETDGLTVLKSWKEKFPETPIVFCSGETRVERAVECLRTGAADYISKPFKKEDLQLIVGRVLEKKELAEQVERLKPLVQPYPVDVVAESQAMKDLLAQIEKLRGQPHINVLILGESGTGKEVLARAIHQQENLNARPFVVANMPAIPSSLMEAELFGIEKGAYTDAKKSRAGKFEQADGGDIFLDEIGDLPLETQAKLLRTLQEKKVERVGGGQTRKINFRVVSATNRPLKDMMEAGTFREDLLYRLNDVVLWVPPLRERTEEIPKLCEHFIRKYSAPGKSPRLSEQAIQRLQAYNWPGNIRELESTIKRALAFNQSDVIENISLYDAEMLSGPGPNEMPAPTESGDLSYSTQVTAYERQLIAATLKKHQGNRRAAMEELRLPRATFYRKVSQLKVPLN